MTWGKTRKTLQCVLSQPKFGELPMVDTMEVLASETMNNACGSEQGDSEWRAGYLGAG